MNNAYVLQCCVSPVSQVGPLYPGWQWQTGSPFSVALHSPCTQWCPLHAADSSRLSQDWPEYPSAHEQLYEEPLGTHTPCTHLHKKREGITAWYKHNRECLCTGVFVYLLLWQGLWEVNCSHSGPLWPVGHSQDTPASPLCRQAPWTQTPQEWQPGRTPSTPAGPPPRSWGSPLSRTSWIQPLKDWNGRSGPGRSPAVSIREGTPKIWTTGKY